MGGSIGGISMAFFGGRVGFDCVLISNVIYIPFQNSPVSSFIPDNRKWASGAMREVAAAAAVVVEEASGVDSLSGVTGWLVVPFAASLFILLIFCFCVPIFCFCSRVFVF